MPDIGVFSSFGRPRSFGALRAAVIVDSVPDHCVLLLRFLSERGFKVLIAHGWFEAVTAVGRDNPQLLILQQDGEESARAAALSRMLYPDTCVIQTAEPTAGGRESAGGDENILFRPVNLDVFDRFLSTAGLLHPVLEHR